MEEITWIGIGGNMSNKPWKKWKTRKTTLLFSICFIVIYIIVGIIMCFTGHSLDSTLTTEVFSFFKWLTVTGCAITIAKVAKGEDDSDADSEDFVREDIEDCSGKD